MWSSPIPEKRWTGFRAKSRGSAAFESLAQFEEASLSELEAALADHELATLGRLLARGKKLEIENFIRTHGCNPLFDPNQELDIPVGIAKADVVNLASAPSAEANRAILDGHILHVLFQAGEATRFAEGPLYQLNPLDVAERTPLTEEQTSMLAAIWKAHGELPKDVGDVITKLPLGPKQPICLRAALRRVVQDEVDAGRLSAKDAPKRYQEALGNQKILFFVSRRGNVNEAHDVALRTAHGFYGFNPANIATVTQELARGITADESGRLSLLDGDETMDAGGHLYALIQAARTGDFATYTDSGRPIKPMESDALAYFANRGATILSVVRINDMDRHSTEIINAKALAYAQRLFSDGYVNAIETVANPDGQKGGLGTTFDDPSIHVLTETHENAFPSLARAVDAGVQEYLKENKGRHPAYNAMRQWSDLAATRRVLKEFGGRIVFVPRQKGMNGAEVSYLGVDMPMGDLSLLYHNYKSRMFQFAGPAERELLIHDMKKKENIGIALRTLRRQLEDPNIIAAVEEIISKKPEPFRRSESPRPLYGAPCPEFD